VRCDVVRTYDPFIECSCGHRWQHNDAWELNVGSEVECPKCEKTLECVETDVTRTWAWARRALRGEGEK
jgi:hypothetical protein